MTQSSFVPTSRWSLIARAQQDGPEAQKALGELLRRYENLLITMIRLRRHPPGMTPEDVKQDFVVGILRRDDIKTLVRGKGRFRDWLSVAVRNHLSNTWDAWRAARVGHTVTDHPESFDVAHGDTPERACLAMEALDTVAHVLERQRAAARDRHRFDALSRFLPGPSFDVEDRDRAAAALGMSRNALTVAVWRLQQEFARFLFDAVADTLNVDAASPEARQDVEREMRLLYRALCEEASSTAQASPV